MRKYIFSVILFLVITACQSKQEEIVAYVDLGSNHSGPASKNSDAGNCQPDETFYDPSLYLYIQPEWAAWDGNARFYFSPDGQVTYAFRVENNFMFVEIYQEAHPLNIEIIPLKNISHQPNQYPLEYRKGAWGQLYFFFCPEAKDVYIYEGMQNYPVPPKGPPNPEL